MRSKNQALLQKESLEDLSKEELVTALNHARFETFKYVNKFLEAQEKWAFLNVLLKKLNSIKQKQELCKTICDGFLKLTNSKICCCCLLNQDDSTVEFVKIAYGSEICDKKKITKFIEKINIDCCNFLINSIDIKHIFEYFESKSNKKLIIVPIIYSKIFFGYLMLEKEDENFYKENIHFINIFPEHIALILENISLYQESEKSNKRKIEFLAGISHEFKTPLNSIIGFAEILQSKASDMAILKDAALKPHSISDKLKQSQYAKHLEYFKYVNNILHSAKHLLTLIEDVLDVSKSQWKTLELNYSTIQSGDEISKILTNFQETLKEKNVELSYTLADVTISADAKRFRQLIYNLVSNAIKFNKQNGKINILTYIKDDKFFFEITDTGDGISKKNYEKIFDFFSQVNRNQLKRQLGSGVGLAICKMITNAHKGEINFQSKHKKGSVFWFSLPMKSFE